MIKRILYLIYLIEWKLSHRGKGFKGCTPACFNEWCDCELRETMRESEFYKDNWYYFMIEYLKEKESKEF